MAEEGKETEVVALRETELVVGGSRAVRALYRNRLTVRPCGRLPLRKGAGYVLSVLVVLRPSPDTLVVPTLSADPGKSGSFDAREEPVRVDMPFRASAAHVEPSLVVSGPGGEVVVDDFRLQMCRP